MITRIADINKSATAKKPYKSQLAYATDTYYAYRVECPYCKSFTDVIAHIIKRGSGKRCGCGALYYRELCYKVEVQ